MSESWSKRYNIWQIKSPWLRLPVAWICVIFAVAVYGMLLSASIIYGIGLGARDGFDEWRRRGLGKDLWRAATTVKAA